MALVAHLKGPKKDGKRETVFYPTRSEFIDDLDEMVKLYNATGSNYDGAMTQAAVTEELNSKASTDTATATTAGLMSAADKTKLDGLSNYTLQLATNSTLGGVKMYDSEGVATDGTVTQAGITNLMNEVSNKILLPIIIATAPTKSTVVAKNGDTVLTATERNGKWQFTIPHYGYWTIGVTSTAGTRLTRTVNVNDVKIYKVSPDDVKVYGYRIAKNESDPSARVEYLFDAEGMTPAAMNFETGEFDYGSWADAWFVTENRPLMLKSDGTVDYYLDPTDYTKKEDGETTSDVANTAYDGNAMAQIPLCWVYRYEDDDYYYEVISNVKYDDNYRAYAHTRADGTIAEYFYNAMFGASGNATKLRSLSGQTLNQTMTTDQQLNGATANGTGWYIGTWSRRELIRTLLVLMGKSADTQAVFGYGNCRQAGNAGGLLATGTLKDKGQFYGYNTNNQQVKVFHIEGFWGDQWLRTAGVINSGGKIWVKMTPEGTGYRVTDTTGYINTGISTPAATQSFINKMNCSEYGMIPTAVAGSGSTYFCDAMWSNNAQLDYLFVGGSAYRASAVSGAFSFAVYNALSNAYWSSGCALSFA